MLHSIAPSLRGWSAGKGGMGSIALVVLAAFFWGLSGGIGGYLTGQGWDPIVAAFFRGSVGLFFAVAWLLARPDGSGLRNIRLWLFSALAGLGVAGNFTFYYLSIAEGSVAVAATLMYSAPVFVYLVSLVFGFETISGSKIGAIGLVLLGMILLTGAYDLSVSQVTPISVAAGLMAGVSYAVFIFGFKSAAPRGSPQAILVIAFGVLSVVLLTVSSTDAVARVFAAPIWPLFVVLGVFGAGLSFMFYIVGLRQISPVIASIIAMVEPITAAAFGVVFLHEILTTIQILGMVMILLTVTVMATSFK
ncbi:EamA family transporter [Spiribacter salilacus]|uniref:EamA family transporter n=1 Tax=Spiribacter salilacus TaxID=2664894 RepID=UPI003F763CA2